MPGCASMFLPELDCPAEVEGVCVGVWSRHRGAAAKPECCAAELGQETMKMQVLACQIGVGFPVGNSVVL